MNLVFPGAPICTSRLALRPFVAADFSAYADYHRRPEVYRFLYMAEPGGQALDAQFSALLSAPFASDGFHPEVLAGIAALTPEMLAGTPFYENYIRVAPNPDDFSTLAAKMKALDTEPFAWSPAEIRAIVAPTLVVIGDADIVPPEHAVELFELRGGGVPGDLVGLPAARLAILPGTTHVGVMARYEWLAPMVAEFLDMPPSEGQ